MIESEIFNLIGNFGFPIVAFYLMYQMSNKTIQRNTDAIAELTNELRRPKL